MILPGVRIARSELRGVTFASISTSIVSSTVATYSQQLAVSSAHGRGSPVAARCE